MIPKLKSLLLRTALFCASFTIAIDSHAQTTTNPPKLQQSTFYDANTLYWLLKGYSAYPVLLSNTAAGTSANGIKAAPSEAPSNIVAGANNPVPGAAPSANPVPAPAPAVPTVPAADKVYKVIELSTGKILTDNISGNDLNVFMQHYLISDSTKTDLISQILARNAGYAVKGLNRADLYDSLRKIYTGNLYLHNLFATEGTDKAALRVFALPLSSAPGGTGGAAGLSTATTTTPSGSLPSVNTLVQGLVAYDIQAVNAEIDEAFFVHLQTVLNNYPELSILFPKTLASLSKVKVTSYTQSLNTLKSAYQIDMKNLLSNISGLTTLSRYQKLLIKYPALTILFTSCDLIAMLQQGKSVPDILYKISYSPYIQQVPVNDYNSAVKLATVFSNAFIDLKAGDNYPSSFSWVTPQQLDSLRLTNNPDRLKYFIGLFSQNTKGIKIGSFDFYAALNDSKVMQDIVNDSYIIYNYASTFNAIKNSIDSANKASSVAAKASYYIAIAGQLTSLADNSLGLLKSTQTAAVRARVENVKNQYLPLLRYADSVAYAIQNKDYGGAIFAADTLLKNVLDTLEKSKMLSKADSLKIEDVKTYFVKYGGFIAAIATAQSSDDVKNAIATVALPTGSSRIKKEHDFSWGLNTYVGVYHAWNNDHLKYNMPAQEWGITAPLGIDANFGHFAGGSLSVYGGIIDVGAIFSYTATTNNQVQSQIKLGQILSPSLGVVYGLPVISKYNIPLSIGGNYQWGPELKNVDTNGNSVLSKLTSRFNVFLAIDIPLFNFSVSKN